jgi:hypothetical protein
VRDPKPIGQIRTRLKLFKRRVGDASRGPRGSKSVCADPAVAARTKRRRKPLAFEVGYLSPRRAAASPRSDGRAGRRAKKRRAGPHTRALYQKDQRCQETWKGLQVETAWEGAPKGSA